MAGYDAGVTGTYLAPFTDLFHNTDGCTDVISTSARLKLSQQASVRGFGQLLNAMAGAQNLTGDFIGAAQSGARAGNDLSAGRCTDRGRTGTLLGMRIPGTDIMPVAR